LATHFSSFIDNTFDFIARQFLMPGLGLGWDPQPAMAAIIITAIGEIKVSL
jgi:hypothetical protein